MAETSSSSTKASKGRPSPQEIEEKRRQRAEKKIQEAERKAQQERQGLLGQQSDGSFSFAPRSWALVRTRKDNRRVGIRFLSWNILAQGLVRRKLFPGSDCLKWKDREVGLASEMISHDWDIAAFQEVDRIDVHGPNLERSGRDFLYAKGYESKQHGLMIAWRNDDKSEHTFCKVDDKIVYFDSEPVEGCTGSRTGLSRVTRNIALFAALKKKNPNPSNEGGVLVATTHLFWHPMHAYERVRQSGILKRRLLEWKQEHPEWESWAIIIAGDFNDQPHSAAYKLICGEALTQHCLDEIAQSTVVHSSVDEMASRNGQSGTSNNSKVNGSSLSTENENGDDDHGEDVEEEEDDQMLKNCRTAKEDDLLLTVEEMIQLHDFQHQPPKSQREPLQGMSLLGFQNPSPLISTYGTAFDQVEPTQVGNYFGSEGRHRERYDELDEPSVSNPHLGSSQEPMYTLFSSLFSLTLDYIFVFPSPQFTIQALLPTHTTATLKPGIPRKGICASDHVAIAVELDWTS